MVEERHLGVWWNPNDLEKRYAGNLSIDAEGHAELEMLTQDLRTDFANHDARIHFWRNLLVDGPDQHLVVI